MYWSQDELTKLVDVEAGMLDARIYSDSELYEIELERVFRRNWLFLGHESQLLQAHDFITSYMGEDPVVVVRQKDGNVRAFLNQCRHRGVQVTQYDCGNTKTFTCPYHGWTYTTSGDLVVVPKEDTAFKNCFDKNDFGLIEVPRIEVYKGLIFGCWDESVIALKDYLGEMTWYIDAAFDRSPAGMEVIGGIHKWEIRGNWKYAAEQFASDGYHVGLTHIGTIMSLFSEAEELPGDPNNNPGLQASFGNGHSAAFWTVDPGNVMLSAIIGRDAAEYHCGLGAETAEEHIGAARAKGMPSVFQATIFPNFSFLGGVNTLRVWHPRGPNKMEVWSMAFVPRDAPDEAKDAYRRAVSRTFSPTGYFEQDDGENWESAQKVLRGAQARRTRLLLKMGLDMPSLDHSDYPGEFPGNLNDVYSEEAARGFYGKWLEQIIKD